MMIDPTRMRLNAVGVSPSGKFMATCGDDHQVKLYDLSTQQLVTVGRTHAAPVLGLCWSPDERQVVTVGADCTIAVWNFYGAE